MIAISWQASWPVFVSLAAKAFSRGLEQRDGEIMALVASMAREKEEGRGPIYVDFTQIGGDRQCASHSVGTGSLNDHDTPRGDQIRPPV